MQIAYIEKWALDIIERVEKGDPIEDFRVELKSNWIDPVKAARRLAGHANAARGQAILWLIGVDEVQGVVGVKQEELTNWLSKVNAQFEGLHLSPLDFVIPHKNGSVVALFFETDRAPFVVKIPEFGQIKGVSCSHEVPWREGTKIRTARRSDLLRVLVPQLSLPDLELLSAELTLSESSIGLSWHFWAAIYVEPEIGISIAFPYHRCDVNLTVPGKLDIVPMHEIRIVPPYRPVSGGRGFAQEPDSHTVAHNQHSAIIYGPGWIKLSASLHSDPPIGSLDGTTAKINVSIRPTHVELPIKFDLDLYWEPPDKNYQGVWKMKPL
jgi:hypothetical protein